MNSPTTFINLMNRVFLMLHWLFFIVFVENMLIYLKNEGYHMNHLRVVLQVRTKNKLFAKYRKCEFCLWSVAFLCHIIYSEGVKVDLMKTKAVKKWPRLLTPIDIRSFLGLAGLLFEVCGWFWVHYISLNYFDPKE